MTIVTRLHDFFGAHRFMALRNARRLVIASVGSCLMLSCADVTDDGFENGLGDKARSFHRAEEEAIAVKSDELWQGVLSADPHTVGISTLNNPTAFNCSAAPLTPRVLLTAAHCLPANNTTCGASSLACSTGTMRIWRATGPGTAAYATRNVKAFRHSSWSNADHADNDIAVVVFDTDYTQLAPLWVSTRQVTNGALLEVLSAWGTTSQYSHVNSGRQNMPPGDRTLSVDWNNGNYMIDDNDGDVHVCKGDSGSPIFHRVAEFPGALAIAGVATSARLVEGRLCSVGGSKQRWTLTQPKLTWIENRMKAGGASCLSSGVGSACCWYRPDAPVMQCF